MESKLREYRMKRKLTQAELAKRAGTTWRYIAFIESGQRTPSLPMAARIAKAVKAPIEKIFLF